MSNIQDYAMTQEELQEALEIDPYNLRTDCAHQPALYAIASQMAADFRDFSKRQKLLLEKTMAELALAIRSDPKKYDVPKITDSSVSAAIACDLEVIKIKEELLRLEKGSEKASAIANAYEIRRSMLRAEVELFSSEMMSGDTASGQVNQTLKDAIIRKRQEKSKR